MALSRLLSNAFTIPSRVATVRHFRVLPALMKKLGDDYNFEQLNKDPFFMKKFQREIEVRDADKDGKITRHDFDLMWQRHAEMGTPEHKLKELRKILGLMADSLGLPNYEVAHNFEEYGKSWANKIKEMGPSSIHFAELFHALDTDDSGKISYDEWVKHYKSFGIDPKYARASFDAMDADGDGKVSKQEFIDYNSEYYYTAEDNLKSSILYGPLD